MAGCYDIDFDHTPNDPVKDALGTTLSVGDKIAHIAKIASRTRVTRRVILYIDIYEGTMTITPSLGRFTSDRLGKNVRGANVLRLCQCQQ